ncbi:MAG: nuclear transport factor 2 family protein [Gammaproteobacteria bacterium]|nr:nuclear transport factor 2 family protein [Gammaproteobacteria bacterium]
MNAIQKIHTTEEQKALDIFNQHVAAFTSGNLDAVVNDFGEQSVVITPDGVFEGLDQIRSLYQHLLGEFGVINRGDSPGLRIDTLHIRHDTLFITWHAESINHIFPFGTDTFVCRNGKVQRQSISFPSPQPR